MTTLKELQSEAHELGLSTQGTKQQLYNRIYYVKQKGGRVNRARLSSRPKKVLRKKKVSRKKKISRKKKVSRKKKASYFKRGNKLSEKHRKYCRCVYHVADKQSPGCLRKRKWQQSVDGKQCYNPYAICSKSTKRKGSVECFKNTNLSALPSSELKALADLKRMSISELRAKHRKQ